MKLTRHNGRSGKHGTYNPRHNDRRFDVENSEHIDAERARQNVYWDCYRGFTTHDFRESPEQPDFSFEEIERMYYYEHYSDHVDAQNARNEKTRHIERNRTVDDLLKNNKTCPEESIYQIGTMEESIPPGALALIVSEFYEEFERRFGSHIHILAITDGVDSLTRQEMDITPFKNILNDMYSRDISKKVLSGITIRSRQGKFCGGTPPLGLMRDPEDKGHLIIDPKTSPIIRKIYDYALDGLGYMRISKKLMEEKIPVTHVKSNTERQENYYYWAGSRISHILRNPFYKGAHLVFRTHQKGIRSNTYDIVPREEWEIIENCHEAIVSPEEWDKIQELIDRRPPIMQGNACPFYNLFHGIIYCATCGKSMQVRYEKVGRTGKNRFTGEMREPIDKAYYICQTYNRLGKNACTSHKIEARDLYDLVLKDIQELATQALKDADAFYQRLSSRMECRYMADAFQMQKERERLEARNREIDEMFLNLYTDKAKGILSEQRFVKLTATMEQEQEENQRRLQELLRMLQQPDAQESEVRTFIREIRQYATFRSWMKRC